MSEQIDILVIDNKIRSNFIKQKNNITVYENRLVEIEKSLSNNNISDKVKKSLEEHRTKLNDYINDIKNNIQYNFYVLKTVQLIEEYKKILDEPIKISFLGKPSKMSKEKQQIIKNYLEIVQKEYIVLENENIKNNNRNNSICCTNCNNKKDFDIIDNSIYICNNCFAQQNVFKYNSSYNDIDRINISSKYMYDRKVHFRDCMKQYQGKQNSTIVDKVYEELIVELSNHHLLIDSDIKEIKFKNVTKNHVLLFLKELGYSNHYENVHLIHYNLTGKKPADISHLEDKLLDDFDILTELYDKKYKDINRKNFINTQYVLYQLLKRHKYECNKEEFVILKTIDRKFFHDEVCQNLFEHLGWNHTPFY
jgi:hypothetical protein